MAARAAAPTFASAAYRSQPGERSSPAERLRLMLLWLTGVSGALVFIEPSPYEIASLTAIVIFAVGGLSVHVALLPFAILLILINIGYTASANALLDQKNVLIWVVTSWYLAVTALFFAAMLGTNTQARLAALMRGCMIAGVIAAVAGVAAYFRLIPGSAELLLYDRARGTYKDPNVFGAFLVPPALLALQMVIAGHFARAARGMILLALFTVAILLSFSRGAWGQLAFTGAMVLALTFLTTPSATQRLRIVLIAMAGVAAIALLLAAVLSVDVVANLFKERMSLGQDYDVGETGRFGRHLLGAILALDVPFGVGPLQFNKIFPEDPHNSYLNAFMSGGWLSGVCYPTLVLLTLAYGLRCVFIATPWQSTMIVIYSAYAGMMVESIVIDSDHWRHVFLLLGVLWGLIAATRVSVSRAGQPGRLRPSLAPTSPAS
jgi:hypothetical protein